MRCAARARVPPHVLVMTATPIPRTVAMTVFGDLETSTLRELPAGRAPITTHVVPRGPARWMARTWERVAEEVRAGRQAYVVCPRIGDDDVRRRRARDLRDRGRRPRTATTTPAPTPPAPLKSVYAVHAALARASRRSPGLSDRGAARAADRPTRRTP